MRIFIIVPLDCKVSTLSVVGQQFEKKVSLLSTILGSLGHEVDRQFINADTAKLCTNNHRKQLELLADMLNRIVDADEVFSYIGLMWTPRLFGGLRYVTCCVATVS